MFNNSNWVVSLSNNNLCYLSHCPLNDLNTSYVSIHDYFNLAKLYLLISKTYLLTLYSDGCYRIGEREKMKNKANL